MTNAEIRAWYLERVSEIAKLNIEWTERGVSLENRARRAWQIRHDARLQARMIMESQAEANDLVERDRRLYGNPEGPTFDQLVQENHRRGLKGDEVYEQIIDGSQTTNVKVNKLFEAKKPPP